MNAILHKFQLHFFVIIVFLFASCQQIDIFEKNTAIPNHAWQSNFSCNGTFEINDTTSLYNIYVVLRHTDAYKYNNIWLNIGLQSPGDTMYFQKTNLSLGDDAKGWYGAGMDDIWEVRKMLTERPKAFRKKGVYHFSVKHNMRDEPLKNIMSAGLRVEKVKS
jgi:gliding motility-associated lipoprotein GldH